ncbi:MAG TPA: ATP-binding protein [Alphaproteobacteria bacterium]|jgi:PAS domain S-box-containing protein|nr:ATP-binding protein [Alphaproteobacteria bacterium]
MEALAARLREAEETLDAIRNGDVDAVVVTGPAGQQVYTLENADRPYRLLIEQMQEGAVTLSDDGTVLYCNERFAAIVETSREAIIGHGIDVFFVEIERGVFLGLLTRGPGTSATVEFTLRGARGTAVPVNISLIDLPVDDGSQRIICGVVTDLTHSHRRNHELAAANASLAREIEERGRAEDSLSVALDAAGMGSWDLDLATGEIRRSVRCDEIFGYAEPLESFDLQAALNHIVTEDRAAVAKAFVDAEAGGSIDIERRIRRAGDDALRWAHIKGRTYYGEGKPVRIAGVVADVTDRKLVEEQLRQAQKMEAVGQLTGGIAHDFNNLLMIIGGSLDLLHRAVDKSDRTTGLLDAARQGVARGAKLNQQLLAFSRRQDLHTEAVCVNDLIPDFEHLLDRAVGEMVAVRIEVHQKLWHCSTDPHQLETAIVNLAINARDAMPNGGTLTLSTANRTIGEAAAMRWGAAPGDYVVVSVRDTGIGMTPEVAARVFEPFFTTKEVGKGTGLGLSQVYGFAKQSGGFVALDTEVEKGTDILIHLPRTDPVEASREAPRRQAQEATGKGTILVVEDDAGVRETASALLRDLGYLVTEADTAQAALDLVSSDRLIALVFTDVIMPGGINGIELANEITRRRPDLPVLLTSGYTAQRLVPDSVARVWSVLRKPYTQTDLSLAVSDAIDRVLS